MSPTIKPYHYGRIAHQHNRVALTARAIGDKELEAKEKRMRDATIKRAHSVREHIKRQA